MQPTCPRTDGVQPHRKPKMTHHHQFGLYMRADGIFNDRPGVHSFHKHKCLNTKCEQNCAALDRVEVTSGLKLHTIKFAFQVITKAAKGQLSVLACSNKTGGLWLTLITMDHPYI